MRLNLPQDVPHELELPRERKPETPLELSPVERRRERLAEQADHPRRLDIPTSERRQYAPEQDRDLRPSHSIPHDQRPQRQSIPLQAIGLSLRDEEVKLLADVGRFRVVATRDLTETIYDNRPSRLERDLDFLRQRGLVQVDSVQARRDGRRGQGEHIEVLTAAYSAGIAQSQLAAKHCSNPAVFDGTVAPVVHHCAVSLPLSIAQKE